MLAVGGGGEGDGEDEPVADGVFEADACVGLDVLEDGFVWVVVSVGAVHGVEPFALRLEVELVKGIGEASGAPPLGEERGVGVGVEDGAGREGERALVVDDGVGVVGGCGHK